MSETTRATAPTAPAVDAGRSASEPSGSLQGRDILRLSIVVCSYNQARYLRQTLISLIIQTGVGRDELEIIVIDGGSTDGSIEIIREFEPYLAYWVSEPDQGQTDALRKGFERATGDLHGWLCSDDELEPDTARTVLDYFRSRTDARWAYGDARFIDESGRILRLKKEIPFNWFIWLYDYNYVPQPSTFWRADLYRQTGGLDTSLHVCMDEDLWARFAEASRPHKIPTFLSRVRLQPEQKTQRLKVQGVLEGNAIRNRYGVDRSFAIPHYTAFLLARVMRIGWKLSTGRYW